MMQPENVQKSSLLEFWRTLKPALSRLIELNVPSNDYLILRHTLDVASSGRHSKFTWSMKHIPATATSTDANIEYMMLMLCASGTAADDNSRRQYVEDTLASTKMGKSIPIMVLLHYKDR